jgi:polyisoprenoid-binding protein YceI
MKIAIAALTIATVILPSAAVCVTPLADLAKVEGGHFSLDKQHARIVFSTTHFGFSTYYAFFDDFDARLDFDAATPEKSTLSVTINLNGIVAADPKLEANLKSDGFFDVAKFPKAVFSSTSIELRGNASGKLTGDLSLHGLTKPVTLDVTFNGGGVSPLTNAYILGFDAKGTLRRSDFGIKNFIPVVGDQVTLVISCEFDRVQKDSGGE